MARKNKPQGNKTFSASKQSGLSASLQKKCEEYKQQYQDLQKEYGKLCEEFSANKNEILSLCKKLSVLESDKAIEKLLRKEAYAFILVRGLLDEFVKFRDAKQRTKTQEAIMTLVSTTDFIDIWIDL